MLANSLRLPNSTVRSPIAYADDLDELPNGDVIFSDASAIPSAITRTGRYDAMRSSILTFLQGRASGRLLRWRAATGETEVLVDNLWFPNGVAISADHTYVVFAETYTGRILKHWLEGPRAGTTDIIVNRLPGYPDGVSLAPDGNFWVAIVTDHNALLNTVAPYRLARWALAWITDFLQFPIAHIGAVLKVCRGVNTHRLCCVPYQHTQYRVLTTMHRVSHPHNDA